MRGFLFGFTGFLISVIFACFGVLPPFLTLQSVQEQTRFSQVDSPPKLFGTMWSSDNSFVANFLPQYWHLFSSRAKMFLRLNLTSVLGRRS